MTAGLSIKTRVRVIAILMHCSHAYARRHYLNAPMSSRRGRYFAAVWQGSLLR